MQRYQIRFMRAAAAGIVAGFLAAAVLAVSGCAHNATVDGGSSAASVAASVAPTAAGEFIVSEIMPDPVTVPDLSGGEWIELYNPGSETFNLIGCEIYDLNVTPDSHSIYNDLLIAPGEYITLANGPAPGFTPTYDYPPSNISLANVSDNIYIECGGTVIDSVAPYDGTFPYAAATSAELSNALLDATSNDTGTNWCVGGSNYNGDFGTPNAVNDCP